MQKQHLLVDGSNILHAWPELRSLMKRDRDAARQVLSKQVRLLHDALELRVTLVFDGRGAEMTVERPGADATFALAYTPSGMTADDAIEQMVGNARDPGACLVATDDRAERQTITALGAKALSSDDLRAWIVQTNERQATRLSQGVKSNDRTWPRPKA